MDLQPLLGTKSLRAFRRLYKSRYQQKRAGMMRRYYLYKPRGDLIRRLSEVSGLTYDEVLNQLKKERIDYLRTYYPSETFKDWEVV